MMCVIQLIGEFQVGRESIKSQPTGRNLPPMIPGIPLIGNGLTMAGDIHQFLVRSYLKAGPAFRVRALNQEFIVLAGLEANKFLQEQGAEYFSSKETMGGLTREFNMRVHTLEGEPHAHLRKTLGQAFAASTIESAWERFAEATRRQMSQWKAGTMLPVVDAFQRLAADQLSVMIGQTSSCPHFDTLRFAFELMLDSTIAKKYPAAVLRLPAYQEARRTIFDFVRSLMAERRLNSRSDAKPDLIDRALNAVDERGEPYPEAAQIGMILQGYFGGINTVAYLYSFMLYALLKYPEVARLVRLEIDGFCGGDEPTLHRIREMKYVRGLVLESLRMWPTAPASMRTAKQPFSFSGYDIPEGAHVMVATCVPHHLPEYFPDPYQFNIARREFNDNRRLGVFVPFSTGEHTCLGAGLAEVQAAATVAYLVYGVEFEPLPKNHRLNVWASPGPNPGSAFRVKIARQREHAVSSICSIEEIEESDAVAVM